MRPRSASWTASWSAGRAAGAQAAPADDHRRRVAAVVVVVVGGRRSSLVTGQRLRTTPTAAAATPTPDDVADGRRAATPAAVRTALPAADARRRPRPRTASYPAAGAASKPVNPPQAGKVPTEPAHGQRQHGPPTRATSACTLDNAKSPVHGQQLRQPGPAGLLRRHHLPPAHHRAEPAGAAVRRPDRHGHRRPRLPVRRRVPDRPVPPDDPTLGQPVDLPARHARDGQRRPGHQRQPVLPGLRRLAAAAAVHGVRHDRRRPAWQTLDKIAAGAASTAAARTVQPQSPATTREARSQLGLTDLRHGDRRRAAAYAALRSPGRRRRRPRRCAPR